MLLRPVILLLAIISITSLSIAADNSDYIFLTESSPPNQIMENGRVSGTLSEKIRQLQALSDIQGELQLYPWARALKLSQSLPNAFIFAIARVPEREDLYQWVCPIVEYHMGLISLTSREDINIRTISDLENFSIASQRDDYAVEWFEQHHLAAQLVLTPNIADSWQLLADAKVDLIIEDSELANYMAMQFMPMSKGVKLKYPLPELNQIAWLAANPNVPASIITRMRSQCRQVFGQFIRSLN